MNPMSDQQHASPDAGWKNPTGQWSGSNGSVRKLLLLIYKSGVSWWDKIRPSKDHHDSDSNHMSKPHCPSYGKTRGTFYWGCNL